MKSMLYQFYNEGFATTFVLKPINFIKKSIKNQNLVNTFSFIIKFIYTILMILVLIFVIYLKFFYKK